MDCTDTANSSKRTYCAPGLLGGERLGKRNHMDFPMFPKNHFELSHTITKPKQSGSLFLKASSAARDSSLLLSEPLD